MQERARERSETNNAHGATISSEVRKATKLQKEVDELKEEIENLEAEVASGTAAQMELKKLRQERALQQEVM